VDEAGEVEAGEVVEAPPVDVDAAAAEEAGAVADEAGEEGGADPEQWWTAWSRGQSPELAHSLSSCLSY
jgi:hypothetical protein